MVDDTVSEVVGPDDVIGAAEAVATLPADADWSCPAGGLDWTCRRTLDHLPDTLMLYAGHLASRATRGLPFLRDGDQTASPRRLLVITVAAAHVLAEVATAAGDGVRAFHPAGMADAEGFCAMGCDELLVHGHDIAAGLGVPFDPPAGLAGRVLGRLFPWAPTGSDPWQTLLWANGRTAIDGQSRLDPDWYWHAAPLTEWDGTVGRRQAPPGWR